jgi:hypothetical protein
VVGRAWANPPRKSSVGIGETVWKSLGVGIMVSGFEVACNDLHRLNLYKVSSLGQKNSLLERLANGHTDLMLYAANRPITPFTQPLAFRWISN